ncbi:hypothetical protein AURANDRAFT_62247 [Aureococcus anophagefferens]|uniref:Uncharacterized protein n=1 Tax=Aureococcus anophagefferens TaxID=44056 RepID=F0Y156_AURAN|nr:hypothetical protein AURANDRAFT_62247 [Aureococcus anophagefferens]EGB10998.1 hypothetical protein AURANDRAFT_62247 [Aureococcus anophagefferens]|eukprot:XP_009034558.1 hypothetical protein AURANDRAFT_62247 [Aureococcus anophagefferens]
MVTCGVRGDGLGNFLFNGNAGAAAGLSPPFGYTVQTITTSADEVTPEVQTLTTSAVDVDEIQTVLASATISDEILGRLRGVESVAEKQCVTSAVGDTPEVQAFGFCVLNADTNQCSLEASMGAPDADRESVVPTFDISWDITDCGLAADVDFCQRGVDEDSTTSRDSVPTNDRTAASIDLYDSSNVLLSTADMETAFQAMPYSSMQIIIDADGVGRDAGGGSGTTCTGVYHVEYRVTFTGRHHRDNVPSIALTTSSALSTYSSTYGGYTAVSGSDTIGYLSSCCDSTCSSSCPDELGFAYLDDQVAYSILEGNQPDGSIKLEYECEARTSPLDSAAVTYGSTSALLNGAQVTVKKGDWVRLGTTSDSYYEVDKVYGDGSYQANVSFATAYAGSTAVLTDAEVGVFYSDPSSDDGVSSACATSRVRSTDVINVDASAATWSSTLRSVATIESASDYLVVTAAKPLPGNGSYVGLYVDVEFLALHGDLKPMVCDTSYLTASSDATSAYCNVTTLQDGSLADGDFSLTTYWPNERVAKPSPFNATGLRWNSPSDTMDAVMERVGAGDGVSLAFGLVDVSRSAYTPSTDARWSGGYAWTVTFLSAIGNVPQMKVESNVTVSYAAKTKSLASSYWGHSAVTLEVEDESSGSEDTYQGDANSYTFGLDSTGVAADGGQVSGSYGLTFGDTTSADTACSVANATSYKAISDAAFKAQFQAALFAGRDVVDVSRSSSPNRAAAYTYTITYRSAEVGGDVALLGTDATQLSGTGASVSVSVEEEGAQIYGSFQLRFNGYTTGVVSYDASAEDVEAQLNALQSISPSKVTVSRSGPLTTGPDLAPNAYLYRVSFVGAGDVDAPESNHGLVFNYTSKGRVGRDGFMDGGCNPFETEYQNVTAFTAQNGLVNKNNCTYSGCLDGVIQRGNLTLFQVEGDPLGASNLPWNAREYGRDDDYESPAVGASRVAPSDGSGLQEATHYELQTSSSFEGTGVTTYTIDTDRIPSALVDDYESPAVGASRVAPSDGSGLQDGLLYYHTAINSVGYSLPQATDSAMRPTTTPGAPTFVVLSTVSTPNPPVQFSGPTWDGGDEIMSYLVEYATDAAIPSTESVTVLELGVRALGGDILVV